MVRKNIPEYLVSEISESIKGTLEDTFGYIKVRGEVSGLSRPSSGHIYLNLKDEKAVIKAIIWRSSVAKISFKPEEGLEVVCSGKLTTGYSERYPGRSDYSIIVDNLKPAGEGALMALLEERKKKFTAEGLFDQKHKKQLPYIPKSIGVITSPTGAVIKDILHRLKERFPCNVILWPVTVQGDDASDLISRAIKGFNELRLNSEIDVPDVIIVARGGGSIEDLWPFNEENVVRASFESVIPLVSAVGHETDNTLIDYVSDLRAPTPTAAAELCTPVKEELIEDLSDYQKRLSISIKNFIDKMSQDLNIQSTKLPISLKLFINDLLSGFQTITSNLNVRVLKEQINSNLSILNNLSDRINIGNKSYFNDLNKRLKSQYKLLESLSYKSVLKRGYSVTMNTKNKILKSKKDILTDSELIIETNFATLTSKIKNINDK